MTQISRWSLRAALSLIVVGAISGCAALGTAPGASGSSSGIPWVAAPGKAYVHPAAGRACGAADLRASVAGNGIYHGQPTEDVVFVNTAAEACFLPGAPSLGLARPGQNPASVSAGAFANARVDLDPGQQLETVLTCASTGAAPVGSRLTVSPAGGGSIAVDGVNLPSDCAAPSILVFQQGPTAPATGLSSLSVRLNLPANPARGQVMSYSVSLVNSSAQAISLGACPSYTQHLSQPQGGGVSLTENTYRLNCAAAPSSVPANGTLSFRMVMRVPSSLSAGPAKFLWNLEIDGLPASGAVIQVA